eukprot:TRINITY_DN47025_c0_g1_i1.p1 TRINITY_DN47025_c0_g1~~TRINITY_DN47025_c0_g1_i1.p1  ORF type:complete len:271 (+),score=-43.32 TRINITY_DN47025_c0_g1_i1:315-1127(+)
MPLQLSCLRNWQNYILKNLYEIRTMAGHSKWHNIQHRKGSQDAKRGKTFTKLIREITMAAKIAGPDFTTNPRLRAAIEKAYTSNMSKDTVEKAIKRGTGTQQTDQLFEITYEGYGPYGIAIYVESLTDNKNRTVAEVRHAFTKAGGALGTSGSVAYLFSKKSLFIFSPLPSEEESNLVELAITLGIEDINHNDQAEIEMLAESTHFFTIKEALCAANFSPYHAEIAYIPTTQVTLTDPEQRADIIQLLERLQELDDVQNVYSNLQLETSC